MCLLLEHGLCTVPEKLNADSLTMVWNKLKTDCLSRIYR